jgi:GNAT superfamily N-acetyltransferase
LHDPAPDGVVHTTILAMLLRIATKADAVDIARLHTQSWLNTYRGMLADEYLDNDLGAERRQVWEDFFATPAPSAYLVLAEEQGTMIGFACAIGADDPEHGTLLSNLHVERSCQSRGLGAVLMAAVAQWTVTTHPTLGMYLWALEANLHARRFYSRLGGIESGPRWWTPPVGPAVLEVRYAWARPQELIRTR